MNKIRIKVTNYPDRVINKLISNDIFFDDINYLDKDNILLLIDSKDYKIIKRLNYYSNIDIIKYYGYDGLVIFLKENIYKIFVIIFCFALMDIISSFIVRIDVLVLDSSLKKQIILGLDDYNVKKYHVYLPYNALDETCKNMLDDFHNKIEWISIKREGMRYVVRVEERIIKDSSSDNRYRDIISKKDAEVTKIISSKGDVLVRSGDYVKKGDVLISGNIMLNDNKMGTISATGDVYGKVWYNVDVSIPLSESVRIKTNNYRYNFIINNKIIFKNKYHFFTSKVLREIKVLGFKIKVIREYEEMYEDKIYSYDELNNLLNVKVKDAVLKQLNGKGEIISQKVLKKSQNNSTINYRVFVVTNELISSYLYLDEGD